MDNLRIRKIINFAKERKSCSIAELMEEFGVSSATIHRDIELLAKRDAIERVRGGIIYNDAPNARATSANYQERVVARRAEKIAAAQMCVDPYELTNQEAAKSHIGANKLIYAPYLMGERTPHLDSDCRGIFFGLSAMHQRRDLLRAVMEGVTYSLNDCLGVLGEMGVAPETMLACGGGGKSPLWRQMLADVMNCPVATTVNTEGPALGVAILAGVGAGLYKTVQEACKAMIKVNAAQNPIPENVPKYAAVYQVFRKLYTANKDLFKDLSAL